MSERVRLEDAWPRCALGCGELVRPNDPTNWRQVTVWLPSGKSNGSCMQGKEVLAVAHDACGRLARMGVIQGQGALEL